MKGKLLSQVIAKLKINRLYIHILSYFLLLATLVLIVELFFYLISYRNILDESRNRIIHNQKNAVVLLDDYINMAYVNGVGILNNHYIKMHLKPYNRLTESEKLNVSNISALISNNKAIISNIVDEIFIYNDDQKIYTGNGVDDYNLFLEKYYKYKDIEINFWKEKLKAVNYYGMLPPVEVTRTYSSGLRKKVIPLIITSYINGYNTVIVLNLDVHAIESAIKNSLLFKSTEYVIINDQGEIILCSNPLFYSEENPYFMNGSLHFENDGTNNFGYVNIKGTRYLATFETSKDFGWKFCYYTAITEIEGNGANVLLTIMIVCSLTAAIGIFLAFIFTRNIYNPIKNIREILKDNQVLSEEDEKEYDGSGLTNLNSDISKLSDKYNRILKISRANNDYALLMYLTGDGDYYVRESACFLDNFSKWCGFSDNYYMCIIVRFMFTEAYNKEIEGKESRDIKLYIADLIHLVFGNKFKNYVLEAGETDFIVIVNIKEPDERKHVLSLSRQMLDIFNNDLKYYRMLVGVGNVYENIASIERSFDDAMTAVEYSRNSHGSQLIDSAKMNIDYTFRYSFHDEKRIMNCIEAGDTHNLGDIVVSLVKENEKRYASWKSMQRLFNALCHIAHGGLDENTDGTSGIFTGQYSMSTEEKINTLLDIYQKIIDSRDVSKEGESHLIATIRKYIDKNYHLDISLQRISEKVGYSAKYISKIFKEHTGYNISDYINFVRIMRAKELIINTRMNMDEIMYAVGIPSRTTFVRVFKKYEGIPPSKFREIWNIKRIEET